MRYINIDFKVREQDEDEFYDELERLYVKGLIVYQETILAETMDELEKETR